MYIFITQITFIDILGKTVLSVYDWYCMQQLSNSVELTLIPFIEDTFQENMLQTKQIGSSWRAIWQNSPCKNKQKHLAIGVRNTEQDERKVKLNSICKTCFTTLGWRSIDFIVIFLKRSIHFVDQLVDLFDR